MWTKNQQIVVDLWNSGRPDNYLIQTLGLIMKMKADSDDPLVWEDITSALESLGGERAANLRVQVELIREAVEAGNVNAWHRPKERAEPIIGCTSYEIDLGTEVKPIFQLYKVGASPLEVTFEAATIPYPGRVGVIAISPDSTRNPRLTLSKPAYPAKIYVNFCGQKTVAQDFSDGGQLIYTEGMSDCTTLLFYAPNPDTGLPRCILSHLSGGNIATEEGALTDWLATIGDRSIIRSFYVVNAKYTYRSTYRAVFDFLEANGIDLGKLVVYEGFSSSMSFGIDWEGNWGELAAPPEQPRHLPPPIPPHPRDVRRFLESSSA